MGLEVGHSALHACSTINKLMVDRLPQHLFPAPTPYPEIYRYILEYIQRLGLHNPSKITSLDHLLLGALRLNCPWPLCRIKSPPIKDHNFDANQIRNSTSLVSASKDEINRDLQGSSNIITMQMLSFSSGGRIVSI